MAWWRRVEASVGVLEIHGRIDDARATEIGSLLQTLDWQRGGFIALIVKICSNGGSLGAAQAICEAIETVRSEANILCVSVVLDTALSAAFYVALASDWIVVSPAATVGNVGSLVDRVSFHELGSRLGIAYLPVASASGKGVLHPLAPPGAQQATFGEAVRDAHDQFVEWVGRARGVDASALTRVSNGQILTGRQALELRLVDANGGMFTAIRAIGGKLGQPHPRLVWINRRSSGGWALVKRALGWLRGA